MYDMLSTYGGKVPPNDQLNLDDLKEVVAAFSKVRPRYLCAPSPHVMAARMYFPQQRLSSCQPSRPEQC